MCRLTSTEFFAGDELISLVQRVVVAFLLLVEVLLAAAVGLEAWPWWLLLAWPMAAFGGYAAVLAVEFVAASFANADLGDLRPTFAEVVLAWWKECSAGPAVFLWQQPFAARRYPDELTSRDGAPRRGVLLVHGFFCNRGFWNSWLAKLHRDGRPFAAVDLEPAFGSIDGYVERIESAFRALERANGLAPVVVGHSMGGIAVRAWLAARARAPSVRPPHAVVTIGSPHHGTALARRARATNGRQMATDAPWLKELAAREDPALRGRFTCFWGACDNIVFPQRTATLEGAHNIHLAGTPHVRLAFAPEVYATVLALADQVDPADRAGQTTPADRADQAVPSTTDRIKDSAAAGPTFSSAAASAMSSGRAASPHP